MTACIRAPVVEIRHKFRDGDLHGILERSHVCKMSYGASCSSIPFCEGTRFPADRTAVRISGPERVPLGSDRTRGTSEDTFVAAPSWSRRTRLYRTDGKCTQLRRGSKIDMDDAESKYDPKDWRYVYSRCQALPFGWRWGSLRMADLLLTRSLPSVSFNLSLQGKEYCKEVLDCFPTLFERAACLGQGGEPRQFLMRHSEEVWEDVAFSSGER